MGRVKCVLWGGGLMLYFALSLRDSEKKKGLVVTDSHCFMIDGVGFPFEMYHCGFGVVGFNWRELEIQYDVYEEL